VRTPVHEQDNQLRGLSAEQREQLMIQAAKLYYDLDHTQIEIGLILGLNRFQIARLLKEARETGLVHIEIVPRAKRLPPLESRLQRTFGLKEAIIVGSFGDDEAAGLDAVARAAANYLASLKPPPALVGVSWGRTMSAVAERLPRGWNRGVEIVLLNGATHLRSAITPTNTVAERFAAAGGGTAVLLPVPAIVGDPRTRQALEADPIISRALDRGAEAPVACFGFGGLGASSVLVESGYIDAEAMFALRGKGAVGDILGRIIDRDGRIIDEELDRRTIGLSLEALRGKSLSIGISAGPAKHAVLYAALRSGYINAVVTDEATADYVLEHTHVH
jgi:deoxyribonucleoside regulator